MLLNSSLDNIFATLLAFQDRLTTIQNGQEDFCDKSRSGGGAHPRGTLSFIPNLSKNLKQ